MWNGKVREPVVRVRKLLVKYKYTFLVILAGVILLLLPDGEKKSLGTTEVEVVTEEEVFDLEAFETKLQNALQNMDGVGKTAVILTLKTGSERVLATDQTVNCQSSAQGEVTDYDMDSSKTTVVISSGSGTQEAIVVQRRYPQFQGALIICQGGGSTSVQLRVTQAVSAVTGLGSDQIHVAKMS